MVQLHIADAMDGGFNLPLSPGQLTVGDNRQLGEIHHQQKKLV